VTSLEIDLKREPGLTSGVFTVTGLQGDDRRFSRVSRDYDPAYMSVEFLGASREVPVWGLDTLSGSGGWPSSIVAAIPGLEPGMEVRWSFAAAEFGRLAEEGFWFHWTGGTGGPDSVIVRVESREPRLIHTEGFTETGPGVFVSRGGVDREIWIATPSDWPAVDSLVLHDALEVLASDSIPPDLREAVIQSGAQGTGRFLVRARTLISDNIRTVEPVGEAALEVRPVQEILDSRRANPLEAAVLFCAMARLAGHEAVIGAAREDRPPFPYPVGWRRFLVRVETPDGAQWFEPSAPLTPAGHIRGDDTLFVLLENAVRLIALEPGAGEDYCREEWTVDPAAGRFTLLLDCRGSFDTELRGRLGGMPEEDAVLALSEWFRESGIHFFPESCSTSDFFDLSTPAVLEAGGILAPSRGAWRERTPRLEWSFQGSPEVVVNGEPIQGRALLKNE
jgi:hypothetical protein